MIDKYEIMDPLKSKDLIEKWRLALELVLVDLERIHEEMFGCRDLTLKIFQLFDVKEDEIKSSGYKVCFDKNNKSLSELEFYYVVSDDFEWLSSIANVFRQMYDVKLDEESTIDTSSDEERRREGKSPRVNNEDSTFDSSDDEKKRQEKDINELQIVISDESTIRDGFKAFKSITIKTKIHKDHNTDFNHFPQDFNRDVYLSEDKCILLYWYLDKEDPSKGSWRTTDAADVGDSSPDSPNLGAGFQYPAYKIDVANKYQSGKYHSDFEMIFNDKLVHHTGKLRLSREEVKEQKKEKKRKEKERRKNLWKKYH